MRVTTRLSVRGREHDLVALPGPLDLAALVPGAGPWEVELGFGKGRHLLAQARAHPERRYLGIELVSKYYRMLTGRAHRAGIENLVTIRGEALYLLATALPRGFAEVLHVYFPDPWPKSRHHRRRLFDPTTVDLVLGALRPGGTLFFATDFLAYGEQVATLLAGMPGLEVERRDALWPDGPRTNYEAKYVREGRPILRLVGRVTGTLDCHPDGYAALLAAHARRGEEDAGDEPRAGARGASP